MSFPIKKFLLYGVGGAIWALTDLLFLYLFTEYVGLHYLISQLFSFLISFCVWFLFQKHVTFQKKWGALTKQGTLFLVFQVIGIGINMLIMRYLVEYMHIYYVVASVIAKIIVFARNFGMNYRYNFK